MRKLLKIVVISLLTSTNVNADIPTIKVDALECYEVKTRTRGDNYFIFFSEDKKYATTKTLGNNNLTVYRTKYKVVGLSYERITLRRENLLNYKININRTNGDLEFWSYGMSNGKKKCKEYKNDLDLENMWKRMVEQAKKQKDDAIKF
tara:strand:+ start:52 stop:495 length:444 start_codon:yes stop_codon:yes gene_type:complete